MHGIGKKILFVDDDREILRIYEAFALHRGYEPCCAQSGDEALRIMVRDRVRVFCLDLLMSEMDGVELCRRIKRLDPFTCVYALSGYADGHHPDELNNAGFDGFFEKPVRWNMLFDAWRAAFEKISGWGNQRGGGCVGMTDSPEEVSEVKAERKTKGSLGMVNLGSSKEEGEESEGLHWERFLSGRAPSLDQVSALAGDRELSEAEKLFFDEMQTRRGAKFFQDLLFVVTHQIFPAGVAEDMWLAILRHKYEMSEILKRNIRITVAALDYLGNLKGALHSSTVINEDHAAAMVRLTMHDGLTRLFNHASFFQKLELEISYHALAQKTVALMMLDIDDFKEINDRYGHHAGDLVLAAMGPMIESMMRVTDICCRYGGEEFAVILPATNAQEAGVLAERLCAKLEQSLPGGREITVSIGVAACGADICTALELVEKADAALYQAKRSGKNRVVISASGPPSQTGRAIDGVAAIQEGRS